MSDLLRAAKEAADDAHFLLGPQRYDSAVSRAYYAIFNSARAALIVAEPALREAKTHKGLLQQFSRIVIEGQGQEAALGKALRRLLKARIEVAYEAQPASADGAQEVLATMDQFLAAIEVFIGSDKP